MRDLLVVGLVAVVAVVLGTFLFFFEPSAFNSQFKTQVNAALQASGTGAVHSTVLAQGMDAISITNRTNYRIQNAQDLQSLWALVYGSNDTPNPPTVDFSKNEVLAVFDGAHATNGYSIKITSITDGAQRVAIVTHDVPGTSCTLKHAATSPFEIVEVPKTSLGMSHQDQTSTSTCP